MANQMIVTTPIAAKFCMIIVTTCAGAVIINQAYPGCCGGRVAARTEVRWRRPA